MMFKQVLFSDFDSMLLSSLILLTNARQEHKGLLQRNNSLDKELGIRPGSESRQLRDLPVDEKSWLLGDPTRNKSLYPNNQCFNTKGIERLKSYHNSLHHENGDIKWLCMVVSLPFYSHSIQMSHFYVCQSFCIIWGHRDSVIRRPTSTWCFVPKNKFCWGVM